MSRPCDNTDLPHLIDELFNLDTQIKELSARRHQVEVKIFKLQLGQAFDKGRAPIVAFRPYFTKYEMN
jgi:hypothetical protein